MNAASTSSKGRSCLHNLVGVVPIIAILYLTKSVIVPLAFRSGNAEIGRDGRDLTILKILIVD
jgi:hypothetical protein